MTSKRYFASQLWSALREGGYFPMWASGDPHCTLIYAYTAESFEAGKTLPDAIVSGPNEEKTGRRYGVLASAERQQEIFRLLDPVAANL